MAAQRRPRWLACSKHIWYAGAVKTCTFRAPMTNHLFQKIRDATSERESRLFLETPAGFALTDAEIALSGRYPEALALR